MPSRLVFLILLFVGLLTYFPTLQNGFIIGDDEDQILNHPLVHDPQNIPQLFSGSTYFVESADKPWGLFYRPLMLTVFSLIYAVFGPDPLFFHLFSLLLHILNAYLVYLFLELCRHHQNLRTQPDARHLVAGSRARKFEMSNNWTSFLITLIFLVHPINSEAVLHAANLQELLFTCFGLLLLLRVLNPLQPHWYYLVQSLLLSVLCLFAKETGLLFIILAIVLSFFINRKSYFINLPLIVSTTLSLVIYFISRTSAGIGFSPPQFGLMYQLSLPERLLHLPSVLFYYLKTFIFPLNLAAYQDWLITSPTIQNFYLPLSILIGLSILLSLLTRHSSLVTRYFVVWTLLFLLPLSHLYPLYTTVAERWFYPVSIGLLGLIALILKNLQLNKIFLLLLISLLSFRTHLRAYDWRDSQTLLEHDLPLSDSPFYAQNLLATIYLRQARYTEALPLVEKSIQRFPNTGNLSNRGVIAVHQKDYPAAKAYYQQALSHGRIYGAVLNYMNLIVFLYPDYPLAQTFIEENLKTYPHSPELWLGLAVTRYYQKDPTQALKFAQKSYSLAPLKITQELLDAISQSRPPDFASFLVAFPPTSPTVR